MNEIEEPHTVIDICMTSTTRTVLSMCVFADDLARVLAGGPGAELAAPQVDHTASTTAA